VSANDPVQAYKEIQIKTANQIKLIVMLYDGTIRHINHALDSFTEKHKSFDRINSHLIAAQDIISELMASLDFDKGGDVAKGLFAIYAYMKRQLMDGNIRKEDAPVREVKKLLIELRDAWEEISTRKGLEERSGTGGGVNIAG
jgi:flagellar secretion chaperone FliS